MSARLERLYRELQTSESYLAEAQQLSHTGSFGWNVSTGEIYWSAETFRIFEFERTAKVTTQSILDRTHPEDRSTLQDVIERASRDRAPFDVEHRLLMPNGVIKYLRVVGRPSTDQGQRHEFVGAVMEITDRKRAEEALAASERNLATIINTIPTTAWTTRPDGYCDFLNQRWLDYAGMTAEQAQGWGWAAAIHSEDVRGLVEYWQSSLASGTPVETEARIRRFDGAYRWFLFRANPLRDESGKIIKWYGTNIDIQDRKRGEEELRSSELSWRQIADSIPGLVATTSAMGEVEFLNLQTLEYFGRTSEELKDWALMGAVHSDDLPRVVEARKKSIEEEQIYEVEHRCRRADGVYRWFQARGLPVRNAEGTLTAWYLLLTDIDDRKKAEEALQSNERNLSLIINTIPTHIYVLNTEGSVQYVNQAVMDYTGLSLEDVKQGDYRDRVIHPEDFKRVRAARAASLRRGAPFSTEQRVLGNDGQYRWFLVRYKPLLDEQGRIVRWYVAAFDIEDRKRAEDVQARQARVRADVSAAFSKPTHLAEILRGCTEAIVRHLDAAFARIWMLDKDESMLELQASAGMYTRLDGSYSRIPVGDLKVGWIAREKKAHLTNDVMNDPRVNNKGWAQSNGMVAFTGYPLVVENRLIGVVALFARRPLPESILDTLASVADTIAQGVERKRAEEALKSALDEVQKSESKLRQVIDAIPALAWCNLPDGSNEFLNKGWHEYTGLSPEESHGWGWQAVFHPEDLPQLMERWRNMLGSGESGEIEARLRRHDGVYRWFLIRAQPFRDESGKIVRWYGTSTDIDGRKRAEAQLEQAYLHLTEAQRLSKTGSFITDLLVDEHNWSEEARRIFEFDPATKVTVQTFRDKIHPEDLPSIDAVFARGMAGMNADVVFRIVTSGGVLKHIHGIANVTRLIEGRPVFSGALQDVTESKVAEEALDRARSELAHVARVTTLNALTASIAHEINQPLSGIVTNASTCLRMLNGDPPNVDGARETARRTIRDGNRASDVITRLRALFSKREFTPEPLDLNEATQEVIALSMGDLQRNRVVLRSELAEDLPPVVGDRVQLQQVVLNLLRNASDAMVGVDERPRQLLIRTGREGDDSVRLSVQDEGTGIDPQELEKLFEAFYTTKTGGMGIGLSVSRSIIDRHRGRLWAEPNDGPGATFSFSIPCRPGSNP